MNSIKKTTNYQFVPNKFMFDFKRMLALIAYGILSGCSSFPGTPRSPLDFSDPPKQIASEEDLLNRYASDFANEISKGDIKDLSKRNELISKALTIIDVRYAQFINETELNRKNKEMLTDFVELSMNLAGTAVGAAGTKTILAAISAGVNGINAGVDKNYFYEKTFPSLVAQMNADRKEALIVLTQGLASKSPEDYPWSQAVHDLINYYNAGTLLGAIMSVQKDAGTKESKADFIIKGIRKVSFKETKSGDRLINFLETNGVRDRAREDLVFEKCIKPTQLGEQNKFSSVIFEFLTGDKWDTERNNCINKLIELKQLEKQ